MFIEVIGAQNTSAQTNRFLSLLSKHAKLRPLIWFLSSHYLGDDVLKNLSTQSLTKAMASDRFFVHNPFEIILTYSILIPIFTQIQECIL